MRIQAMVNTERQLLQHARRSVLPVSRIPCTSCSNPQIVHPQLNHWAESPNLSSSNQAKPPCLLIELGC
eukprot:2785947-Prorocentrum_lima.AAC.1